MDTLILSSNMFMLYLSSLSTVFLLNSVEGNKVIMLERNVHYNEVTLVDLDLFLGDQSNFSLIECLVHCEMIGSECLGTFYNRILRSCKFMSYPGNMELALKHQAGSGYYSINPCEIGWSYFDNHCYYMNRSAMNWVDAKLQCLIQTAHLAEIESTKENSWIMSQLAPRECISPWYECTFWIGGNDFGMEGFFVWTSDDRPLEFSNWSPVEPNSYSADDNCIAVVYPGGEWVDFGCSALSSFLCKKPVL